MDAARETMVGVGEIMTRDVVTIAAGAAVADAAAALDANRISGMPVLDESGALVGMVSEYDVISKRGKTVADIMSQGVISVEEDAAAEQVADLIGMHGIRRVPVVRDGRLVGIVSRADLMRLSASMRWTCADCGAVEFGIRRPARCIECGSTDLLLARGTEGSGVRSKGSGGSAMHDVDPTTIPVGTNVVAVNGSVLGTVHLAHEHYLLVDQPDEPHASLTVPAHAIARFEGQVYLSVNREALSVVDHDESAGHRLEGE